MIKFLQTICIFLLCAAFWVPGSLHAQVEMSTTIKRAFDAGTRSVDGTPGPNYWQNGSDYDIKVSLDPATRILSGTETVTYSHNAPDSLGKLVIRLYQDIFKRGNTRDFSVPEKVLSDGVDIKYVKINGQEVDLTQTSGRSGRYGRGPVPKVRRYGTNLSLRLDEKLASGSKLTLEAGWSFVIPKGMNLRMGTYGAASFFVSYFYPQIAVFDDIDGWDMNNYTGMQEMYNDFGKFNVEITVPDSLMVWATGALQNPEEVLTPEYLERFKKAHKSSEVIQMVGVEDHQRGGYLQQNGTNTWKFKADLVPDFAFGVSDSFLWDATSALVDAKTGRRVLVNAAYKRTSKFYDEAAEIGRLAIEDMSNNIPGVPYPYPCASIFNGNGGMEYPGIVNDGPVRSRSGLINLTYHEIAHSYFPFYTGFNERKYAWMDEGWATFLPTDLMMKLEPKGRNPMTWYSGSMNMFSGSEMDVPLMTPSIMLKGRGYSVLSYSKPAVALHYLREMIGDDSFQDITRKFVDRWNGKHPIPHDFFHTYGTLSGKDLDWFWKAWYFEALVPDLALADLKVKGKAAKFNVKNEGGLPVPIHLKFTFTDGSTEEVRKPFDVWKSETVVPFKFKFDKEIASIKLGNFDIPESHSQDNKWSKEKAKASGAMDSR